MFGLFKKEKGPKERFLVYKTQVAKYRQLVNRLNDFSDKKVILAYFFKDTKEELQALLKAANIVYDENSASANTNLLSVEQLKSLRPGKETVVIIAEVYPTRNKHVELLNALEGLEGLMYFVSLDSAFFSLFGGERIVSLLEKLGVDENECIEHTMVTKSIVNAQEKIGKKVITEKQVGSLEEWLSKNLPENKA